ncbi:MAG: excinuclease ABC subunit UvrA [Bacteroidota bacterium]
MDISKLSEKEYILVKGARVHNLKNIDVAIPRNKFVVITGVSGSGKSSLAFDTLYAEGQRRYVESLSSYARQFLGRMDKPDVDYIKGITPAIAIEQKVTSRNPRSTVGTATEIYDYMKLLFARIGKTISPVSNIEVKRDTVADVVDFALNLPQNSKVVIAAPFVLRQDRTMEEQLKILLQQGFSRVMLKDEVLKIEDIVNTNPKEKDLKLIIDRVAINDADDLTARISDSVQIAFFEGHGSCDIVYWNAEKVMIRGFSSSFNADNIYFEEPSVDLFSFNNPYGACPVCEGFGNVIGIDEDLVVPNKSLSVYDEAIVCWRGEKMGEYKQQLIANANKFDFPIHKPYIDLSEDQRKLLWTGNKYFMGIFDFFKEVEANAYKIQYRVMLARYRGKTTCHECGGSRLRKEANYVKINNHSISELTNKSISDLLGFFKGIQLDEYQKKVANRLIVEITYRLQFMKDVGLGYLTLSRVASTLSGGESQRMNLSKSLGSSLVGSTYILDEPSIGLHSRDTKMLIEILKKLRDIGNTVIVVEHDEEIIKAADYIIDIGLHAGRNGGNVVFNGTFNDLLKSKDSLTAEYLSKKSNFTKEYTRKLVKDYIEVKGARENNLKSLDVKFPLNMLTVVTGVSGSGKSTLVNKILYAGLKKQFSGYSEKVGMHLSISGDISRVKEVEMVDQNPIGRSSRSNPVTYLKAFDEIRELYAQQQLSKIRGYKPGFFSFNVPGGRCDECDGEGIVTIEMQFMADVHLLCESCKGSRYKNDVLEVLYKEKNIADILKMTINEAIDFFSKDNSNKGTTSKIVHKLQPLVDVGLGYLQMGQSSSTLSGGEAQRIKLASFLARGANSDKMLFIFDEPTTGLHFNDIDKLLLSFEGLLKFGHSLIIIEHNPQIIEAADWVIDLGPEGGINGGNIVFEGTPENLLKCNNSHTAKIWD